MKRFFFTLLGLFVMNITYIMAQPKAAMPQQGSRTTLQRKFNIILQNESDAAAIQRTNANIIAEDELLRARTTRGLLGDALKTAYKSAFMSKTVNASSNLLSLGISTIVDATKSKRNEWYKEAQQQCRFEKKLTSDTKTDDFYALPSENGALDPQNMAFKGFGLQHYLENPQKPEDGQPVFKFFCSVKTDEEGISSIVNHGKFLVDIDELWFKPMYCGLPNDPGARQMKKFDFAKRKNLQMTVKVKLFASWFSDVMAFTNDQQLGEFYLTVKIDKDVLNSDSVFVYDPADARHQRLVSLTGDCFMVPRSFTGTMDGDNYKPTWGTGQYRIEMELTESCDINNDYYTVREAGNARKQVETALPGKTHWDKSKWKTEWTEMKAARRSDSVLKSAWQSIVRAYKGNGWIETFTDPLATSIASWETQKLTEWLKLSQASSAQKQAGAASGAKAQGAPAGSAGGQQSTNKPQGTNQPQVK